MIRTKLFLSCALAAAVALLAGTTALAQGPVDQRTFFTFSGPFELPGDKTLPAGKYTFRIVDSPSNRHVVQVLSEDGRQLHATIFSIPAQRQDPPSEPEVRFMEAAANTPPAVRTWWYPGRTIGHEFIYPRAQARRLAARQSEPVLTVRIDTATIEEMRNADLSRVSAAGEEAAVNLGDSRPTNTVQVQPAPERMPVPTPEPAPRVARETRNELPRTASPVPLVGLIGLFSLVGAGALRLRRR